MSGKRTVWRLLVWGLIGITGLLLLVPVLLYVPAVQRFVVDRATERIAASTGMRIGIEQLRVRFPLRLSLDGATVYTASGDTLLRAGELRGEAGLIPLLHGQLSLRGVELAGVDLYYRDTTTLLTLTARLDSLTIPSADLRWKSREVTADRLVLAGARAELWPAERPGPPPTDTAAVPWRFRVNEADLSALDFRLHGPAPLTAALAQGSIRRIDVDLVRQRIAARTLALAGGRYAFVPDTAAVQKTDTTPSASASNPWDIRLDRLELADNAFRYGTPSSLPVGEFDADHLDLSEINANIVRLYYRPGALGATLDTLAFTERSGLALTGASGTVSLDSLALRLTDFDLKTAHSSFEADGALSTGLLRQEVDAPLELTLHANVDPNELYYFYRPDARLRRVFSGRTVVVSGELTGTPARLAIRSLDAAVPGHIDLKIEGTLADLLPAGRPSGTLTVDGDFRRLEFLRPMLPDSLRGRIGLPRRATLRGTLSAAGDTYAPDLRLSIDTGWLTVNGKINLPRQQYTAAVAANDFPLGELFPRDSLGVATLRLTADGAGFDPRREGARTELEGKIDRFDYKRTTYGNLALTARLLDHRLTGDLHGTGPEARFALVLDGTLSMDEYTARLVGRIDTLDLQRSGFSAAPMVLALRLDSAAVRYRPDTLWRAELSVDSMRWRDEFLGKSWFTASSDPRGTMAQARSGDLTLDFRSPAALDSLAAGFARTAALFARQIDSLRLDMAAVQQALPPFTLQASARRDNLLHALLEARGMDFGAVEANVSTLDRLPLQGKIQVNHLKTKPLTIDTLQVAFHGDSSRLDYAVRLANRPGNVEELALLALTGYAEDNAVQADLLQRNRAGITGFRFGLRAELLNSALRARITSPEPRLGYLDWHVNPENYVLYRFDRSLEADLLLDGPDTSRYIHLVSAPLEPSLPGGAIGVNTRGIDLAPMLGLLPSPPSVGGILGTELAFGFHRGHTVAGGQANIRGFRWKEQLIGDVGARFDFQTDSLNDIALDAAVTVGGKEVLTAEGTYLPEGGQMDFRAGLKALPLSAANAFIPADAARLDGMLIGQFTAAGSTVKPVVGGELTVAAGRVTVQTIGTTYRLADTPIRLDGSVLDLNRFAVYSPGNRPLVLDGTVDARELSRIVADLSVEARDFDVLNSSRAKGSPLFGKASVDAGLIARGTLDALTVRGNVTLLRGSTATYAVEEPDMTVQREQQQIVTFLDFTEPPAEPDSAAVRKVFGLDLLVGIGIEENVAAAVELSADGSNRLEASGNGNLTYTLNPQGDSRFTGRFDIASGRILYHPPVISQKDFAITPESYVDWTGDPMNPAFDIRATQSVRTTVNDAAGTRAVTFDISILIRQTLKHAALLFDLAAPGDADIQSELTQMTAEQRSQQAMALMLYNTYTGPGTTATVDANNPLNTLLARELNQWARNNLKGVDLSVGIDRSGTGGEHTNYSYQVSKRLFDDRVNVAVGGSIRSDTGAESNLQNNFVADVTVEYRLTRRDNLFLKAFRYNTQESILEGEVVKTGGGILLRKRINRLRDFFKLLPKERRRQLREVRVQEKNSRETTQ